MGEHGGAVEERWRSGGGVEEARMGVAGGGRCGGRCVGGRRAEGKCAEGGVWRMVRRARWKREENAGGWARLSLARKQSPPILEGPVQDVLGVA